MSKYRKPLIAELTRQWSQRFPLWRPGICAPVRWAQPRLTFTNDAAAAETGLGLHAVIDLTPKSPGTFTCDVVVTPQLDPFVGNPPHRWPDDIAALPIGTYRIGWFVSGVDIWWRLIDESAAFRRLYEHVSGADVAALSVTQRQPNDWYASSYDVPLSDVIREAVAHFSDTFEQHVVPKLR